MYEWFCEAFHPDVCLCKKGKEIFLYLRRAYFVLSTCAIDDMNNLTTSSLPATLHINASECPRPAWQHCCHRVFTCQILMNMHCVLCFLSLVHGPLPSLPSPPFPSRAWCTPSTNTTSPTSLSYPIHHPHHH